MFAIIDTETTGGNPVKDRVMEIAIIIHDGTNTVEEFHTLINPRTKIAPFIEALTGITNEMVKSAPPFEDLSEKIFDLTNDKVFVAHNVAFDYSVLRREFKRLGIRFQRKQLCTVNLSRKLLPGYSSYSLGKLCADIGIPIKGRHRAYGDAKATSVLFHKLIDGDSKGLIEHILLDDLENINIPSGLPKEIIDDLPEETGVFYLIDSKMNTLFIGKARNLRQGVISLYKNSETTDGFKELLPLVNDITYELTGNELIAQLMEQSEIKKYAPKYNHKIRLKRTVFGIYHYVGVGGFINLEVERISTQDSGPLIESTTAQSTRNILKRLISKYELHPNFCGLKTKNNPMPHELIPKEYNTKVSSLIRRHQYRFPNFFIIGEGRSHHEQSIVWIENNSYRGYGFFEPENIENDIQSLKDSVTSYPNNADVKRLVRNWLRKKKKAEIIKY